MNNTTPVASNASTEPAVYQYYDDEFSARIDRWKKVMDTIIAIYDTSLAFGIICGVVSVVLLLSLTSADVRRRSVVWFVVHQIATMLYTCFLLHLMFKTRHYHRGTNVCKFMMYSLEYVFFMCGYNIFLINVETIGTILCPLLPMKQNQFRRFAITILATWLIVSLLVAHIVVDNNTSRFCFSVPDKTAQMARVTMKDYFPTCLNFVATIVAIVAYFYHRSRAFMAGGMEPNETSPLQWLIFLIVINSLYIIRTIMVPIQYHAMRWSLDSYVLFSVLQLIHTTAFYALPLPLLIISEVRQALYRLVKNFLRFLSLGKLIGHQDMEPFSLSGVKSTTGD